MGRRACDQPAAPVELGDALAAANGALAADVEVSRGDGTSGSVRPFSREEILAKLERWFFGHAES